MKHGIMVDKSKNAISAKEQEAHLTVLQEERNAQDQVWHVAQAQFMFWKLFYYIHRYLKV